VSRRLALLSAELAAVRPPADPPAPGPVERLPPPVVPVPGRHAARRGGPRPPWVPATLRGRVLLGPAQLAVVAVLVSLGLAATAWWVVVSDAEPAHDATAPIGSAAPLAPVADLEAAATSSGGAPATAASAPATVTVDVAGKVRRPGIAVLDAGSRVVDALEAAGGVRAGADVSELNLARLLVDGEQVLVGVPAPPGVAASVPVPPGQPPTALVNLNTADAAMLDTLPEVGPVTAASILSWREEHGGFTSVDDLLEVDGIGETTLARIAPHVTV
jgi:competence protein ComEA